jgi:hypothetical protein
MLKWAKSDKFRIRVMFGFFILLFLGAFRHVLIQGDHLWTGEGARFSWSMKLKGKVCRYSLRADPKDEWVKADFEPLTKVQVANLEDPLFFLQYVQQTYCKNHKAAYAFVPCRAISYQPQLLLDPNRDLCQASYHSFVHNDWISPHPGNWDSDYSTWFGGTWGKGIR